MLAASCSLPQYIAGAFVLTASSIFKMFLFLRRASHPEDQIVRTPRVCIGDRPGDHRAASGQRQGPLRPRPRIRLFQDDGARVAAIRVIFLQGNSREDGATDSFKTQGVGLVYQYIDNLHRGRSTYASQRE